MIRVFFQPNNTVSFVKIRVCANIKSNNLGQALAGLGYPGALKGGNLDAKLDAQHAILVSLIDRVRSVDNEIIRQDVFLKTMLGAPNLIEKEKLSKSQLKDKRKD